MKNISVLVTGGAGFIGANLVRMMIDVGYKVSVFDIMYFSPKFLPVEKENLKGWFINMVKYL